MLQRISYHIPSAAQISLPPARRYLQRSSGTLHPRLSPKEREGFVRSKRRAATKRNTRVPLAGVPNACLLTDVPKLRHRSRVHCPRRVSPSSVLRDATHLTAQPGIPTTTVGPSKLCPCRGEFRTSYRCTTWCCGDGELASSAVWPSRHSVLVVGLAGVAGARMLTGVPGLRSWSRRCCPRRVSPPSDHGVVPSVSSPLSSPCLPAFPSHCDPCYPMRHSPLFFFLVMAFLGRSVIFRRLCLGLSIGSPGN